MTVIERETRETKIRIELARGTGVSQVSTGVPFLDHMMHTLARYSSLDLRLDATGDLKHHTIEDVAIVMGAAVAALVTPTIARYGEKTIPMDDALVQACVDVGGRAYYEGPLPSSLYDHWMQSFSDHAKATVHIVVIRGKDRHHIIEAAFKALGMSLRTALAEGGSVFSTKGSVSFGGG